MVFMISGLTAGLREELFYRGIVQNVLQRKYDSKIALSIATIIFSLSHVQYLYEGQFIALIFITLAGIIIFGCIFIHSGSIIFTAIIHSLYDAVLSINIVPFRLSNTVALTSLLLIMMVFLIILSKKRYHPHRADNTDDNDQDSFSLS